jgi:hypothetical protein
MSLGAMGVIMAVSITALGGTSMYPWMFLGVLVVAGTVYIRTVSS